MRRSLGDDGAIACCVSPMLVGKQMQFFGARANLAKCLLYAINGGRDEITGEQIGPKNGAVQGEYLDFDDVTRKYEAMMDWLSGVYVNAMNVIHYMHDKYAYERLEMALHDYPAMRTMAFGIAGLSVVADSLSAIRYAKVRVVRDETGLVTDYQIEGDFPKFGNNDNRVDQLASWLVTTFMNKLRKWPTYRNAIHTQSVLTITSNVVYGKNTGNTPDGRRLGEPFAPGANPMHGRDEHGIHASAASVAKIPFRDAADGISLTSTLVPAGSWKNRSRTDRQSAKHARCVFQCDRVSHERQCPEPRNTAGCHGSSGEISAPDDSRFGLCREFRAADSRSATGCHQPNVLWSMMMDKQESGVDSTRGKESL